MLATALVAIVAVGAAAPAAEPARGSVDGPWAFVDLGQYVGMGTFVDPRFYALTGTALALTGGWGVDAKGVRLSSTVRFDASAEYTLPQSVGWSSLRWALAAPDLVHDTRFTGLRVTPVVGLTLPTSVNALVGDLPFTTASLAAQVERRFGPLELAYRLGGAASVFASAPPACPATFLCCDCERAPNAPPLTITNRLAAEVWAGEVLSFGLGLSWQAGFTLPLVPGAQGVDANGNPVTVGAHRSDLVTGELRVTAALSRLLGLSLEVVTRDTPLTATGQPRFPFFSIGNQADNTTIASLSLWFRTDELLQRNWLDR